MPRTLLVGLVLTAVILTAALLSLVWTPHAVTGIDIKARLHPQARPTFLERTILAAIFCPC